MDLAERGVGEWLLVDIRTARERGRRGPARERVARGRRGPLQGRRLAHRAREATARRRGRVELDHREKLPDLRSGALQEPELGPELLGERNGARVLPRVRSVAAKLGLAMRCRRPVARRAERPSLGRLPFARDTESCGRRSLSISGYHATFAVQDARRGLPPHSSLSSRLPTRAPDTAVRILRLGGAGALGAANRGKPAGRKRPP